MTNRKLWISVLAGVLALVAVAGLVAALVPASSPDSEECLHESARPVKESDGKKIYYCPDCNERFERVLEKDVFSPTSFDELESGEVVFNGNFKVGEVDSVDLVIYDTVYREGDSVYLKNGNKVNSNMYVVDSPELIGGVKLMNGASRTVIIWTAPRDCTVSISFKENFCSWEYGPSWSLFVEHKGSSLLPSESICVGFRPSVDCENLNAAFNDVTVNVKAGDRIFFYVGIFEGAEVSVPYPVITYVG